MTEDRKFTKGIYDGEIPVVQMTCSQGIAPGANGKAHMRRIEYDETTAEVRVDDLHNCNCILPHEKFNAYYDDEAGRFCPVGSRGLFRKVRAKEDGEACTNVPCEIISESLTADEDNPGCNLDLLTLTIDVWANRKAIAENQEFWVTYQPDRDQAVVLDPDDPPRASHGRWIPLETPEALEFVTLTVGYPQGPQDNHSFGINRYVERDQYTAEGGPFRFGGSFANLGTNIHEVGNGTQALGFTNAPETFAQHIYQELVAVDSFGSSPQHPTLGAQVSNVHGIYLKKPGIYEFSFWFKTVNPPRRRKTTAEGDGFHRIPYVNGSNVIQGHRYSAENPAYYTSQLLCFFDLEGTYVERDRFNRRYEVRRGDYVSDKLNYLVSETSVSDWGVYVYETISVSWSVVVEIDKPLVACLQLPHILIPKPSTTGHDRGWPTFGFRDGYPYIQMYPQDFRTSIIKYLGPMLDTESWTPGSGGGTDPPDDPEPPNDPEQPLPG